jgi:ABC-type phosphate transport system permease subunit
VISYAIYTVNSPQIGSQMMWTIPPVVYGIFRYLYLIYQRTDLQDPTVTLMKDPALIVNVLLWGAAVLAVVYY